MKYLFAIIALTASTLCAGADVNTTIGTLNIGIGTRAGLNGFITMGVNQSGDRRETNMLVADKHLISNVYLHMSRDDLQKLRDLIDATITELDKK